MIVAGSVYKRRILVVVDTVDTGIGLQQSLDHVHISVLCGVVQWCLALIIAQFNVDVRRAAARTFLPLPRVAAVLDPDHTVD